MFDHYGARIFLASALAVVAPQASLGDQAEVEEEVAAISPAEVIRHGQQWMNRKEVTVRFEVGTIMKVPTVHSDGVREDVLHLVPNDVDAKFTAPISRELRGVLERVGIHDLSEHFVGRSVTIRGYVSGTATQIILSPTIWTYHVSLRSLENLVSVNPAIAHARPADQKSKPLNLDLLAGKWRPMDHSLPLLDEELASSKAVGFEITIDEALGDSHRKVSGSDTYFNSYVATLVNRGHEPVATGYIKFDYSVEGCFIVTEKAGSTYLGYGILSEGNPRIFLGSGSTDDSSDVLVVQWTSSCTGFPGKIEADLATIIYQRHD